ncbi:MAG: kynureninase [Acidimicrobiia bacterium]
MINPGDRYPESSGYDRALELDQTDPLAGYRSRFVAADPGLIYLDGNSLGRLHLEARGTVDRVVDHQWGDRLIRSWNEGWWELQLRLGDLLAPILGAGEGEVIISDSTSVNLFKLAGAAVGAHPGRSRIITDDLNFPSDVYVLDGIARSRGMDLVVVKSDGINGPVDAIAAESDERTALVSLSHTAYMSGYTYDLAAVNEMAHAVGAMVLWDTSHSVGSAPIDFGETGTDLAVGCTYKYLNGGPGSPAFLYVRKSLQSTLENPISAWWAHEAPFDLSLEFEPTEGIRRFHTGTMPILSLAAIEPGIQMVLDAGMEAIREKSIALTGYFIDLWESELRDLGFGLATPIDPARRGSHVSLRHPDAWPITRALINLGNVIPDFRAPDNVRFGFAPLYTSFLDVHTAVHRLKELVEGGAHKSVDAQKRTVT